MCRRHEESFCIAFSQAEDRQDSSVSFLPGACFVLVLHCRKLRQRKRKTNSETLGKGSTKTAGKQRGIVFITGKISFNVQENVMVGNMENYLGLCVTARK